MSVLTININSPKKTFFFILLSLLISLPAIAADIKTIAVLPFAVHSAENIDYVKKGVWDMLIIRVAVMGKSKSWGATA